MLLHRLREHPQSRHLFRWQLEGISRKLVKAPRLRGTPPLLPDKSDPEAGRGPASEGDGVVEQKAATATTADLTSE